MQFEIDGKGIPAGMFERKWIAHFSGAEVDLISKVWMYVNANFF